MNEVLLNVEELRAGFNTAGGFVRAVVGVSDGIGRRGVRGLGGGAGSGKAETPLRL